MKLSIIIPTIGRDTLVTVLKALLEQKLACLPAGMDELNTEIIVVFDGKKVDGEWLMLNGVEAVEVLETGVKSYAAGARNLGLKHATGDVITFIGDDTIPDSHWLQRLHSWHTAHPHKNSALLGKVAWTDELAADPFHQWLEQKALFDYARLDAGAKPNWKHFYTSNISVKKALLQNQLFATKFSGWGFEDSELGYRLAQKGMELCYDPQLVVKHDDPQTLEAVVARTQQARANAQIFENLHPEVKILPGGLKLLVLKSIVWILKFLGFSKKLNWWKLWKQAWLGC